MDEIANMLIDSWRQCISEFYNVRHVNSEACLQCALWHCIAQNLNLIDGGGITFVSPSVTLGEGRFVFPDLVICSQESNQVLATLEIKYLPKKVPRNRNDIANLAAICDLGSAANFDISRYQGGATNAHVPSTFEYSSSSIFVWCGIFSERRECSNFLDASQVLKEFPHLQSRYLALYALTAGHGAAEIQFERPDQ